jgi:uncharacterized membrane protein YfcA
MVFDINDIAILLSIIVLAAFVHGSIGFGFPMVATPTLAMVTDLKSAILITLIPTLLLNISSIVSQQQWQAMSRRHLGFALIALGGSVVGTVLLLWMNAAWFKLLLALMILLYLSLGMFKRELAIFKNLSSTGMASFALVGGLLGGLTNVMAPVFIIYTLIQKYSKEESTVFLNLSFLLGKVSQIVIFVLAGQFMGGWLLLGAVGAAFVGFYFGSRIKRHIDEELYKKIVKLTLFIVAISIVLRY